MNVRFQLCTCGLPLTHGRYLAEGAPEDSQLPVTDMQTGMIELAARMIKGEIHSTDVPRLLDEARAAGLPEQLSIKDVINQVVASRDMNKMLNLLDLIMPSSRAKARDPSAGLNDMLFGDGDLDSFFGDQRSGRDPFSGRGRGGY